MLSAAERGAARARLDLTQRRLDRRRVHRHAELGNGGRVGVCLVAPVDDDAVPEGRAAVALALHLLPVDAPGEVRQVAAMRDGLGEAAFSPDGRWIAFISRTPDERYSVPGADDGDESWQAPRKIERFFTQLNGEGWVFDRPSHVYVVAADGTGTPRNLTPGEIVEQALYLLADENMGERTPNIVYMGMGEPFRNYDATVRSIRLLMSTDGLGIGARRITVSTVGEVKGIEQFANEDWQVRLSVSLHAANDEKRSELIPLNRKYPIAKLKDAIRTYVDKTNRQVTFEWTLLDGVIDQCTAEIQGRWGDKLAGVDVYGSSHCRAALIYARWDD